MLEALHRLAERLRPRLYLWIALAVAIPRLTFVAAAPARSIYGNAPGQLAVAKNIAEGRGYVDDTGHPDNYFNPGYPAFLAACRFVSGDSLLAIKLAHVALDVGTALLLCRLLLGVCSPLAALLFSAAFGFHPLLIHLNNNVNDEPLLMFLTTASVVVLCEAVHRPTLGKFALTGLLVALATYTKGSAILLPFATAGALWLMRRQQLRHLLAYLCVYVAALLPWAYRNYVTFGRFSFAVRGFGHALFFGSDPKIFANSDIKKQRAAGAELERRMEAKGIKRPPPSDVFEYEKWCTRMALENYKEMLSERPGDLARLLYFKATRGLYATEDRPTANLMILAIQLPTIVFGLFGLWWLRKDRLSADISMVFSIYVAYFYLVNAAGEPIVRYFVPAIPLLLAAAAVGLLALLQSESTADTPTTFGADCQ